MHKIVLLALTLTACGGSVTHPAEDAGPWVYMPGLPIEAAADVATTDAGIEGSPPDGAMEAGTEAAGGVLCCSTNSGQNLLVCDPSSPWTCDYIATHAGRCTDLACVPGDGCQGFNGPGVVVVCGR